MNRVCGPIGSGRAHADAAFVDDLAVIDEGDSDAGDVQRGGGVADEIHECADARLIQPMSGAAGEALARMAGRPQALQDHAERTRTLLVRGGVAVEDGHGPSLPFATRHRDHGRVLGWRGLVVDDR
jgi:hypothetical protein